MTNHSLTQAPTYSEPATSNTGSGIMRLSSVSHAIEKEAISKYMNYSDGYFAYLRIGKTSSPIRFYPDAETSYTATLKEYESLLSQDVSGSRASLYISDSNGNIVYQGVPKPNGKINFSVYEGENTSKTVTLTDFHNSNIKNNNGMTQTEQTTAMVPVINTSYCYEEGTHADNIRLNASTFIDNNILTHENIKFLCLSDTAARKLAKNIQEAAIINKEADNETFVKAIQDTSLNMITITKKLASGNPTDENHCSMHDDLLYCAAHCKSSEFLFNGSNLWKRTPGKLDYHKLESAIMDMYNKGRKMILSVSHESQAQSDDTNVSVTDAPVKKEVCQTMRGQLSFSDAVQAITSTIMTYATSSEDILFYLKMKGVSLESETKSLTNDVVSTSISGNLVTFSLLSGISKKLNIYDYADNDALRKGIRTTITHLLVCAAISDKTRDSISTVIDITSIENYVSSLVNIAA